MKSKESDSSASQSRFVDLLHAVAISANQATDVREAMQSAVDLVCDNIGWPVGHVYLLDDKRSDLLQPTTIWYLDNPQKYELFRKVTEIMPMPTGIGLPGRVLQSGKPAWVTNVMQDSNFPRARQADDLGIRAGFGFPVLVGEQVVAVLEFFSDQLLQPDQPLLDLMEGIGTLLGRVVERERSRKALSQSEAKYRALAEQIPAIIYVAEFGAAGHWHYVSPQIAAILGYSPEEWNSDPTIWIRQIHVEDRTRVLAKEGEALKKNKSFSAEYRIYHRDGTLRWVRDEARVIRGEDENFDLLQGVIFDITERKHAEEELKRSEKLLTEAQQIAHIGSWEWDILNDRITWSDELYRIYGLEPQEFGATYEEFLKRVHEEDREMVKKAVQKSYEDHQPFSFVHRIVRPSGDIRTLFARGETILDENGYPRRMVGTGQDITDQKKAEMQTRQLIEEQAARVAAEAAGRRTYLLAKFSETILHSLDYKAILNQACAIIVPEFCDVCLVHLIDKQGRIALECIHSAQSLSDAILNHFFRNPNLQFGKNGIAQVIQSGELEVTTELFRGFLRQELQSNINQISVEIHSSISVPLKARDRALGAMTFLRTGSSRNFEPQDLFLAEDLARRAALAVDNAQLYQQAQEASRVKDEFLMLVSHELRTPLNAIFGWAKFIKSERISQETLHTALESIERNAQAQKKVIDDLLDVAQILAGKMQLDLTPMDLLPVLEESIESIRSLAETKGIRLQSDLQVAGGALVLGDSARLRQVILNLLSNALKFTHRKGTINVQFKRRENHFLLQITDTGSGISPEFLPHMFEAFTQADQGTQRIHGGLGLGLNIVRHLITLHGGSVQAESEGPDRGSTFTITLPCLSDSLKAGVQTTTEKAEEEKDIRILLVEDEDDARDLFCTILSQQGAIIREAASVKEAMRILETWTPDLIISDLGMPGEDGFVLIERLKRLESATGLKIPALALTAYAGKEDRNRALNAGYQMHLAKPVEPAHLAAVVASLVARKD